MLQTEPQIAVLLDWEGRVLEATGGTVGLLFQMARGGNGHLDQDLARVLCQLAIETVGESRVAEDKFRAVNEALLPLLADQVSQLPGTLDDATVWNDAFSLENDKVDLTNDEAAHLNKLLHLAAPRDGETGTSRGSVLALPDSMTEAKFITRFGLEPNTAATKEFGCKTYDPSNEITWRLVQIQAACATHSTREAHCRLH